MSFHSMTESSHSTQKACIQWFVGDARGNWKIARPSVSHSTSLLQSVLSFISKNTKIYLLEGNRRTSMIQLVATDGSSWGLKEKLLAEMLWNRHCHWTNPSHFSLPDCCWQPGSPEVSSLRRVPTAPPLHPCPFITLSILFRSWW